MRIFLQGDFLSDNGPGNANKQIRDALMEDYDISYSRASEKLGRIIETYKGICASDILVICSASKLNYAAISIAKKQQKKILYVLHGYLSFERKIEEPDISDVKLAKICDYEKYVFDSADKIVCVSKCAMEFMKTELPKYAGKMEYIYNVVDSVSLQTKYSNNLLKKKQVISVGGGMRRKNNLIVADALSRLPFDTTFVVAGKDLADGHRIRAYPNVEWMGTVPHDDLCRLMSESSLYIQNSSFETFGLAVIEALYAGCSLLISSQVGCIDLLGSITDEDIIYDVNDKEEIAQKAEHLLQAPNHDRLMHGFYMERASKEWQCSKWKEIIGKVMI